MALSKTKAEQRGSVKVNGREYVNLTVCAQRLAVDKAVISRGTKKGKYTRTTLPNLKGEWYDWQQTRAVFVAARRKQNHVQGGQRAKRSATLFTPGEIKDEKLPPIPTTTVADVAEPEMPNAGILSYFDADDPINSDCWETDDAGGFIFVPDSNPPKHYVDWKKATDKCMANLRYQQYMKQKGELIPKQDVVQILSRVFPPITAIIMQMPEKYASRINGRVEEIIGRPMTNEERTLVKSVLADEAELICHNLQDAVEKEIGDTEE